MTGRRRAALAAAGAGLTAAVVAVAAVTASGGDAAAALAWESPPQVQRVPELPGDRILVGRVRNTSDRAVRLVADDVEVRARDGSALQSTARFAAAFGHALYSPRDAPAEVAAREQERLGVALTLPPGQSAPVTLSWRVERGSGPASDARIAGATLRLPGSR